MDKIKYEITSKHFNDGTVEISVPKLATQDKCTVNKTSDGYLYIDVFDNKEDANEFRRIALDKNS